MRRASSSLKSPRPTRRDTHTRVPPAFDLAPALLSHARPRKPSFRRMRSRRRWPSVAARSKIPPSPPRRKVSTALHSSPPPVPCPRPWPCGAVSLSRKYGGAIPRRRFLRVSENMTSDVKTISAVFVCLNHAGDPERSSAWPPSINATSAHRTRAPRCTPVQR